MNKFSDALMADKLLSAESPFRWEPVILDENRHLIDREIVEEGKFSYLNFIIAIIDVYEKFDVSISGAVEAIETLEKEINYLKESGKDKIFNQIADAVFHVTYSSKAWLFLNVEYAEWTSILSNITETGKMDSRNKAAMLAIQSSVTSLYSYEGTNSAVSQINIAISMDPEWHLWHFIKGWYLRRLRFWECPDKKPSVEERKLFEKANESPMDNALFMVYLADVYRDYALHLNSRSEDYLLSNDSKRNLIEEKYAKSCELYRKSYDLNPENPNVLFRVAYGLMRLPDKYNDLKFVKEILNDASPKFKGSGFGNFVTACYYKRFGKNEPLAMRYFETSADLKFLAAHLSIVIFKFKEMKQMDFNPVQHLEHLLTLFKEKPDGSLIVSQLVSFYVFVDLNLEKACQNALKSLEMDNGNSLQNHRSCFLFNANNRNFSLIDVLTDEVRYRLGHPKIKSNEKQFFNDFIREVILRNIKVANRPQNLRQQILDIEIGKKNSNMGKFKSIVSNSTNSSSLHGRNLNPRNPKSKSNNFGQNLQINSNLGKFESVASNSSYSPGKNLNPPNSKSKSNDLGQNLQKNLNMNRLRSASNNNCNANTRNSADSSNLHGRNLNPRNSKSMINNPSHNLQKSTMANSRNVNKVECARDGENTKSRQSLSGFNAFELTKIDSNNLKSDGISLVSDNEKLREAITNTIEGNQKYDCKDGIKSPDESNDVENSLKNENLRDVDDRGRSRSRETAKLSRIRKNNCEKSVSSKVIDDITNSMKKQELRDVDRDDSKRNRERSNSRDTVRSPRKVDNESHRRNRSPSFDSYSDDEKYHRSGKKTHGRRKVSSSNRSHSVSPDKRGKIKHRRHGSRDHLEKQKCSHSLSKKRHNHPRSSNRNPSFDSYSDDEKYHRSGRKTNVRRKDSFSNRSRSASSSDKSKIKHRGHDSRNRSEKRNRSHLSSKKRHHRHHSRSPNRRYRRHRRVDHSDQYSSRSESEHFERTSKAHSPSENLIKSHRKHSKRSSRNHSVSPNP